MNQQQISLVIFTQINLLSGEEEKKKPWKNPIHIKTLYIVSLGGRVNMVYF